MQVIGLDIETSVQTGEPACLTWSVAVQDQGRWIAGAPEGVHARDPAARERFAAWLADDDVIIVGQNIAFDLVTLSRWWGLLPEMRRAYEAGRVRDTMLRQSLIDIAWPARPCGVWNVELGKWFPAKFAWHAGLGKLIRIDGGEDDDGGGAGAKAGLDHLAFRLLAVDIVKLKHGASGASAVVRADGTVDPGPVRMRYHEVIDSPWGEWPEDFRSYALGDPKLTLEIYFEQHAIVRERSDPRRTAPDDLLPQMFAAGWAADDIAAPLVDEQFQVMSAVPFQVMSARGVRVDRALVRKQRAELARLAAWAADLCVRYGTMREEYDFEPNDSTVKSKPLRKGESPTPERMYRSLRTRCRKLQADDPQGFADFLALARQLGKLRSVERKVDDAEKRARVERLADARGIALSMTKSGKKIKADADMVYDVATPAAEAQATDPAAATSPGVAAAAHASGLPADICPGLRTGVRPCLSTAARVGAAAQHAGLPGISPSRVAPTRRLDRRATGRFPHLHAAGEVDDIMALGMQPGRCASGAATRNA